MQKNPSISQILLRLLGMLLCTVPAAVCIILYFPLWKSREGAAVSGFTVLLLLLAALPLYRGIKKILRSPSAYQLWLFSFILFFLTSRIADEMTVISFVGFVGNALGAICFRFAGKRKEELQDK